MNLYLSAFCGVCMVDCGEDESREEAADVEAGRAVDGELCESLL